MAIILNAKKGSMSINDGYLIITGTTMQKFNKPMPVMSNDPPLVDAEGNETPAEQTTVGYTMEPATTYSAIGQVYGSQEERMNNFGAADLHFAFFFDHVDGEDPVIEAYKHIHDKGLKDWTLSNLRDLP